MRRNNCLSIALVAGLAAAWAAPALGGDTNREKMWEFYIPLKYTDSQSFSSDNGTSVEISGDVGWGFGFGYNFSKLFNLAFELTWLDTNYDLTLVNADVPQQPSTTISGTLDASTGAFTGQYNILPRTFTPFVNAGIGWTYIDSNIPTGPTYGTCWWDPWYGYVCGTWQETATDTSFAYGAGLGVRGEMSKSFYFEASYNWAWLDFDQAGTEDFTNWRLDIGWKF